jgi:putative transposase
VADGEMVPNLFGKIVQEEWFRSASIRKEIRLYKEEFVIMPNHVHGIIWIDTNSVGADGVRPDEDADGARPDEDESTNAGGATQVRGAYHAPLQRKPKSLGSFTAGFKASVTHRAEHEFNSGNTWQHNYYEHIIRDQADYERISGYIIDNPANWDQDDENPKVSTLQG